MASGNDNGRTMVVLEKKRMSSNVSRNGGASFIIK